MTEGTRKREVTAREWLVWLAIGLVVAVVAASTGMGAFVGVGLLIAAVGAFGVVWRLLADR